MPLFLLTQLFALMLLVLVCGNVAPLLFARAASRESEIVVRSALGANPRRVLAAIFRRPLTQVGMGVVAG